MLDLRVSPGSRCGLDHAFTTASRFWCQLRGSRGARLDVEVLCWPRWRWSAPAHSDAASLNRREVARDISSQAQRGEQQPGHQVNRDASSLGSLGRTRRSPDGGHGTDEGPIGRGRGPTLAPSWARFGPTSGPEPGPARRQSGPTTAPNWALVSTVTPVRTTTSPS